MNRLLLALVLAGATLGSGCNDATGPQNIADGAVGVTATLSKSAISLSSLTDSVLLRVTVHNPYPYPITIGADAASFYWSYTIESVDDPLRGWWDLTNPSRPVTLKAGGSAVKELVVRVNDPQLKFSPGAWRVAGGINRSLSAPIDLQIVP